MGETKEEEKRADYKTNETNKGTQLSHSSKPQIFSSFKSLISLETSSLSFCFNLSHTSKPSNQVLIIILTIKRNLALQDNPSIYTHVQKGTFGFSFFCHSFERNTK